ncbi:adhesion G-protein coupled receptor G4 [Myxocyprinus asiaticus]|uniref:adhesion G-protein coupled receptor G4 n=1 Tax=Myxocyprinus asiaticus TaxID=70543 RepID=UPI002222DE6C|nr:adhesion G-protein coupled receptor G4 [Myxocyprinus asiaticus]
MTGDTLNCCKLITNPDFIFIYPLEDLLPVPHTTVTGTLPHTTKRPTTTTLQPMSTTTEIVTTLKPISTTKEALLSSSTATTVFTTKPPLKTSSTSSSLTEKEIVSSSTATSSHISTSIPMETTRTESSSTIKEIILSSSTATTTLSPYITTFIPFMETTLTEISSTFKEAIVSSSTESLFLTKTTTCPSPDGSISDSFFKVNLTVTIEGPDNNPESIIKTWLYKTLSSEEIFVLNFKLLTPLTHGRKRRADKHTPSKAVEKHSLLLITSHSCVFQAKVKTSSNIEETQQQIHAFLDKPYTSGAISLDAQPEDILISHIEPGSCTEYNHQTRMGLFHWSQTEVERVAWHSCEGNPENTANRKCSLGADSNKAHWIAPDLGRCQVVVKSLKDLEDITVTNENAVDILIMIEDLIHEKRVLDEYELSTVLDKLAEVINVSVITPKVGEAIINITSDILESDSNLQPFTNCILNITEAIGDKMSGFTGESVNLVAPAIAISVVNIDPGNFHNLTFGVSSANKDSYLEIYINQEPFNGTVAFISLPSIIQESFPILNDTIPRIQFQFYGVPSLFQTKEEMKKLNTYVVSASVTNATGPIKNLKEYIVITLHHLKAKRHDQDVQCVFWDFNKNDGYGGWNPNGCWTYNVSNDYTTCLCDHLTHFGVLLDVSRTPIDAKNEKILTLITYMGCGVSSCFLGITVLTYTLLEKLRRDYPSKILLNLSLALLGLNLTFLINSWISSFGIYGLCIAVATALHYFLLTSFTWMGLGAVNMYFALVKVFNVYVPSYILKFCLLGWGIPLIICGFVLAIKRDAYGMIMSDSQMTLDDSDMFCWVQDDVVFYVSVVSYIALILLCNGSIFLVVLIQIRNMQVNQPAGTRSDLLKDLRAVASLTFLLGLTWAVAFLAWGPVKVFLLYLFSILNSLQGFFIFVFHCLMKENVRKQWRVHLCCGVFKLQEYSEWSQTATVGPKPKPNPPNKFPLIASVRSIKSNSTQSSSVSSECSQWQVSITRPDLGCVYENSLVIPRARAGLSAPSVTGSGH